LKDQFFHRTQEGRECLIAEGASPASTTDAPKLLGVTFSGNLARGYTDSEKKKLASSLATINKCALLPLPPRMRITCALMAGIAKASWGWLAKTVTVQSAQSFDTAMARLAREPISARSPHLASIFRGHAASLSFMAGQQAVVAAWTYARRHGVAPGSWRGAPLANAIRSFFRKWDWDIVAPWKFINHNISDEATTVSLDPADPDFVEQKPLFTHLLRESWRASLYTSWLATDRRDATDCKGMPYPAKRCKAAFNAALTDRYYWICAIGAFISPALLWQRFKDEPYADQVKSNSAFTCPWCQHPLADSNHVLWQCNRSPKPAHLIPPTDPLQRRLGWPLSQTGSKLYDREVIDWFALTRKALLDRYHSNDTGGKFPWSAFMGS